MFPPLFSSPHLRPFHRRRSVGTLYKYIRLTITYMYIVYLRPSTRRRSVGTHGQTYFYGFPVQTEEGCSAERDREGGRGGGGERETGRPGRGTVISIHGRCVGTLTIIIYHI
jgi:hypothetical protein